MHAPIINRHTFGNESGLGQNSLKWHSIEIKTKNITTSNTRPVINFKINSTLGSIMNTSYKDVKKSVVKTSPLKNINEIKLNDNNNFLIILNKKQKDLSMEKKERLEEFFKAEQKCLGKFFQ